MMVPKIVEADDQTMRLMITVAMIAPFFDLGH